MFTFNCETDEEEAVYSKPLEETAAADQNIKAGNAAAIWERSRTNEKMSS